MKKGFLYLFIFISINAFGQGIEFFHGTWQEAIAEGEKTGKLVFVDSYTTWCGPCKAMAKNVFTKEEVGKFFNENFINFKLDMETKEGKEFDSKYPVSAYPTLFFIDGKGKIAKKVVGGQQVESLLKVAKEAMKNGITSEDFAKEYEAGKRDFEFMMKYIKALNNSGKPSLKIANDYLTNQKDLTEEQKMKFTFESAIEADSKLFENVVTDKQKYIALVGEDKYNEKIKSACKATVKKSIEFETPELFTEAIDKASKGLTKDSEIFKYTNQMYYYQTFKNKVEYLKAADNLAKKSNKDEKTLKFVAEDICKNYKDDEKVLKKATNIAEDAYTLNKSFENLSFYCKMLIDMKDVNKAIKVAESALAEAKKKEEDTKQIENLVNYIKTKKA